MMGVTATAAVGADAIEDRVISAWRFQAQAG
jgi:hypothetical protein